MSWDQLRRFAALETKDDEERPTTCPDSGDLLVTRDDGRRLCVFDGWTD